MANNGPPVALNNEMVILEAGEVTVEAASLEDNVSNAPSDDEMGVRHCFYDFCKQTILHGWHYLADLENHATPSASEATFAGTPISSLPMGSPNVENKEPLLDHMTASPVTSFRSRSRSRSPNNHHHVTLNAKASGSGHANVSITHHHHCCSCRHIQVI
jgi:hypothetical protein